MGRVYNDDQPIPYDSPTQSGFKTRSTPNGGTDNFNELRFEDKKGEEQVFLHAERNQDIEVENDETHWVGNDRKKTVDHDETTSVGNNRTEEVGNDESITIGANRSESVGLNEDISIGGSRTETVTVNENVTVGVNRTLGVGANEAVSVGATRTETIGAALTQNVGAAYTQNVGGAITVSSAGPVTFNAAGGFNIIAPGGTKIVDFELGQFGGTVTEGYGMSFTINLAKFSLDNIVFALNGLNIGSTNVKMDKTAVDLCDKNCEVHKAEVAIRTVPGASLTMAAIKLFM